MKLYKCHKLVHAAIITSIRPEQGGYKRLCLDSSGDKVVPFSWVKKNNPQVGGYFVLYDDGYTSYSPWQAFEDGYSLLDESEPVAQEKVSSAPPAPQTSLPSSTPKATKGSKRKKKA